MGPSKKLVEQVIEGGYCIGCGGCTATSNSPMVMKLTEFGTYQASISERPGGDERNADVLAVCPFSEESRNETEIARLLYSDHCAFDPHCGYFMATYAGHVSEDGYRDSGSSGGMTSWILAELLDCDLVDFVIHVLPHAPDGDDGRLFSFAISSGVAGVKAGAKSRYYPIEMSEVLKHVRENPGRYAIVGLPCFIKSVRLLQQQNSVFDERIVFCISLFCGHLKSTGFAEMLAWQCGVEPRDLQGIDFRKKLEGRDATDYGIQVSGLRDNESSESIAATRDLFGTPWAYGFFKYKACDYCDDIVGETADISIGDAWLPKYVTDGKGTNILVVRDKRIDKLVSSAIEAGRLSLEQVNERDVFKSQAGGFRHRRDGLSYRLHLADEAGAWRPPKRVKAKGNYSKKQRMIWNLRMQLAELSHVAWKEALKKRDFEVFVNKLDPLIKQLSTYNKKVILVRMFAKLGRLGKSISQKLRRS